MILLKRDSIPLITLLLPIMLNHQEARFSKKFHLFRNFYIFYLVILWRGKITKERIIIRTLSLKSIIAAKTTLKMTLIITLTTSRQRTKNRVIVLTKIILTMIWIKSTQLTIAPMVKTSFILCFCRSRKRMFLKSAIWKRLQRSLRYRILKIKTLFSSRNLEVFRTSSKAKKHI